MKWNLSTHLSAVAFIAFATPAHAAEIRCDTCINAAVSAVRAREAGIGLHYIFSVDTGAVFRFQVEREPNSEGAYDWFVFQEEVEPDVTHAVAELRDFNDYTVATANAIWEIHTDRDIAVTAVYDTVVPGAAQNQLFDWFVGSGSLSWRNFLPMEGATLQGMGATILNILKSVPLGTHVKIVFPDGSSIVLTYDQWTNSAGIVPGSARDALGNPIPTTLEEATRIAFDFSRDPSGKAAQSMGAWLTRLGAHMQGLAGNRIACVAGGGITTCSRF